MRFNFEMFSKKSVDRCHFEDNGNNGLFLNRYSKKKN